MDWLGSLVEYAEGGKHFQMYKARDGSIEVALVHDEYAPSLTPPEGTIVMKLKGRTEKPEEEESGNQETNVEEKDCDDEDEEGRPQPLNVPDNILSYVVEEQDDITQNNSPEPEQWTPDAIPADQMFACMCLHVGLDNEHEQGLQEEITIVPEDLEEEASDEEGVRDALSPAQRIYQDLRETLGVAFLTPPDVPSNSLLAACEFIPITQYGGADDYEFYAKGVTLVMEDEDENPVYYRGDALVRIKDNGLVPDVRPPTCA